MSKLIISLYIVLASAALIVLRLGAKDAAPVEFVEGKLVFNINALILLGVFLYGSSFALYTYLISKFDLGYIIPLTTAFVYIIIFSASAVIFKESFTAFKLGGIFLIVCGVLLLNLDS